MLGLPNFDLDITIEGDGLDFATKLADRLKARLSLHKRFKTATLLTQDRIKIDISTARSEIYKTPASLPIVTCGAIKDDLKRRDFTINAMALSIKPFEPERLIDFFNGRKDIRNKKIRLLHDLSFIDDPTRMLRAIRFEQRYGFRIEPESLNLLNKARDSGVLGLVNPHRLKDEIVLIFKEDYPTKYVVRIEKLLGFSFISRRIRLNKKKIKYLDSIYKTIQWFNKELPQHRKLDTWLMYFIGLISDLNPKEIHSIFRRFAFSKGETKRALSFKKIIENSLESRLKMRLPASRLYRLLEPLSYEIILMIKARSKHKLLNKNIYNFLKIYNGMRIHLRGSDLVNLGIPRGPGYKKILERILYARLDRKVNNKQEELKLAQSLAKK